MELPIYYYSLKEFEKNYSWNYQKLKNQYQDYTHYLADICLKINDEVKRLSNTEYWLTIDEIKKFEKIDGFENLVSERIIKLILEKEINNNLFPDFKKGDSIEHYILKMRLGLIDSYNEIQKKESEPDEQKDKLVNELYSFQLKEIVLENLEETLDFVSNKLLEIENLQSISIVENDNSETFETPENEYSGKNELKPKEKLILLDKLGIIDLIRYKMKQPDNAMHLAEIVGAITGIEYNKGTLTGYCNYLIRPDRDNKNSPYNSEKTEEKVTNVYNNFKLNANS